MSFTDASIIPVLAVDDLDRAMAFYREKLGFTVRTSDDMPGGAMVEIGPSGHLFLYPSDFRRGETTAASFLVQDVGSAVRELRGRGVTFEEYDLPGLKTEDGIVDLGDAGRSAWFKDSEGNTLAISTDFREAVRKAA